MNILCFTYTLIGFRRPNTNRACMPDQYRMLRRVEGASTFEWPATVFAVMLQVADGMTR